MKILTRIKQVLCRHWAYYGDYEFRDDNGKVHVTCRRCGKRIEADYILAIEGVRWVRKP